MQPYHYPDSPHVRRHGPAGYANYESYRDWLRDEFLFRCVYCLHRERWGKLRSVWHIDHWQPQAEHEDKVLDYDNLLYSCSTCNGAKNKRPVPNPCQCMLHDAVEVFEDGTIEAKTKDTWRTIRILGLDSPEDVEYRSQILGIYRLKGANFPRFLEWMGFPNNLPDLENKNNKQNTRPSFFPFIRLAPFASPGVRAKRMKGKKHTTSKVNRIALPLGSFCPALAPDY